MTNAGGINPMGCAEALRKVASKAGVDLKIAVVTGDDLLSQVCMIPSPRKKKLFCKTISKHCSFECDKGKYSTRPITETCARL